MQRLKNIAIQLGESCLASDLPALINQKRDLELFQIAKRSITTRRNNNNNYITKLKHVDKPDSDTENENLIFKEKENAKKDEIKTIIQKKPHFKSTTKEDVRPSMTSNNLMMDYTKEFKNNFIFSYDNTALGNVDKTYRNFLKIREIIANFTLSCIKEYSSEELCYIKINLNLIYCYLSLPSFDMFRKKQEKKKIENFDLENDASFVDLKGLLISGYYKITDSNSDTVLRSALINSIEKSQTFNEEMLKTVRLSIFLIKIYIF